MPHDIRFYEEGHRYVVNGVELPSVTKVIAPLYDWGYIKQEVLDYKAELGKAAHAATALFDKNMLDETSVDPAIAKYFEAWKRFLDANKPTWWMIEQPLASPELGFAGTPDRIGQLANMEELVTLDIKCTVAIDRAVGVQLAGYRKLVQANHAEKLEQYPPRMQRLAVQLLPTGLYRIQSFRDPNDYHEFNALLTHHHWSKKNAG